MTVHWVNGDVHYVQMAELTAPIDDDKRWRAEQQQAERGGQSRQSVRAEQAELARLRRENAILKQERDFLKRAAAFFAKESR